MQRIQSEIATARSELANLRKELRGLKEIHKKDIEIMKQTLLPLASAKCDQKEYCRSSRHSGTDEEVEICNDKQAFFTCNPIGLIKSVFKSKNGIPRQSGVCDQSKATLTIGNEIFNNPEHSLEGIEQFSHIWVIFIFHKNNNEYTKAKVKPPRLNGKKVGLFSTRCPYRPNPVGLSLVKLDGIEGNILHLSGVDLLDETPVIDIKPYIPDYDKPKLLELETKNIAEQFSESRKVDKSEIKSVSKHIQRDIYMSNDRLQQPEKQSSFTWPKELRQDSLKSPDESYNTERLKNNAEQEKINELDNFVFPGETVKIHESETVNQDVNIEYDKQEDCNQVTIANWVLNPPIEKLTVCFTDTAEKQLNYFIKNNKSSAEEQANTVEDKQTESSDEFRLQYMGGPNDVRDAIVNILKHDPRSSYRRNKCKDKLYYFTIDTVHVTCWFDDLEHRAEVLKLQSTFNL